MVTQKEYTVTYKVAGTGANYINQQNKNNHSVVGAQKSSGSHIWFGISGKLSLPIKRQGT